MTGIYPGSFDPVTFGHIDIIRRASRIVDRLIVAVLDNENKKTWFTVSERVEHLRNLTVEFDNVEVTSFSGLLVDFAKLTGAKLIIRGLRNSSDYDYEVKMSMANQVMSSEAETVFMAASPQFLFANSSIVKEVAGFGGEIGQMVPQLIKKAMEDRINHPHPIR